MVKMSKEDKASIKKIYKDKLLTKFKADKMDYNDETKEKFLKFLKGHDVMVSQRNANFVLKREINRFRKSPLYDLEFDDQLNEAIRIIRK